MLINGQFSKKNSKTEGNFFALCLDTFWPLQVCHPAVGYCCQQDEYTVLFLEICFTIFFSSQGLRHHLHHCTSIDAPDERCVNHSIKQCQRKHPNQIAAKKNCDLAFVLRIFRTLFSLGYLHLHQNIAETIEKQRVRVILGGFQVN